MTTYSGSNLTERQLAKRAELDPARFHPRTARACQMAEAMRDVYELPDRRSAALALDRLCSWMTCSNVPETRVVAGTLRKEREGIPDWWRRCSTNAILEGLNSIAQSIRRAARGFRNTEYFETMIFLRLGRLDFSAQLAVSSATHQKPRRARKDMGLKHGIKEGDLLRLSVNDIDDYLPQNSTGNRKE